MRERAVLKGAAVGTGMFVLIGVVWAATIGDGWSAVPAVLTGVLFAAVGVGLGIGAGRIREKRFRGLALLGLGLVYLAALVAAAVMILADGHTAARDVPGSIFLLGTVGFGLFAIFTLPALLVGVFLLERWTRPRDP
jgi:hypothetical protein